jgi:hypothetical protein
VTGSPPGEAEDRPASGSPMQERRQEDVDQGTQASVPALQGGTWGQRVNRMSGSTEQKYNRKTAGHAGERKAPLPWWPVTHCFTLSMDHCPPSVPLPPSQQIAAPAQGACTAPTGKHQQSHSAPPAVTCKAKGAPRPGSKPSKAVPHMWSDSNPSPPPVQSCIKSRGSQELTAHACNPATQEAEIRKMEG